MNMINRINILKYLILKEGDLGMEKQVRNLAATSIIFAIVLFVLWLLYSFGIIPQIIYGIILTLIIFIQIGTFTLILIYLRKISDIEDNN